MDAIITTIIAAIVGAGSAGLTHFLDKKKSFNNRIEDETKVFKLEIANTIKTMMNFCHQMCWVTWHGAELKELTPGTYFGDYNNLANKFLTELTEKLAIIAANDIECYNKLQEISRKLISLDARIGTAIIEITILSEKSYGKFKPLNQEASFLEKELPTLFTEILHLAEINYKKKFRK